MARARRQAGRYHLRAALCALLSARGRVLAVPMGTHRRQTCMRCQHRFERGRSHVSAPLQIEDARVIMDRENPFRSRGFGFVTFSRPEDAESAIQNNHDKEWQVSCVVW